MIFKETNLKGNYLIDLEKKEDDRGFFSRFFCKKEFLEKGLNISWVQINNSFNKRKGTLRGLHFQRSPNEEIKLIRCLKGAIWDVVVDLHENSKTFGKWFGTKLSDKNRRMMYVPKGFAHGFISLESKTEILYLVSNFYKPSSEDTIIWNDEDIGIEWPLNPVEISVKDLKGKIFKKTKSIKEKT